MQKNQVRLKDIAEASNVALTTVSAALSGTGRVSEKMRAKILKIAREMNYEPNAAARLLKQKKTDRVYDCFSLKKQKHKALHHQ